MKNVLLMSAMVVSACGGNWSNRDLEFASALPSRAELKATLPVDPAQGLSGVATRHDGLNVGDPSGAYADTKAAVTTANGILDFLLGVVDTVRTLPPSTRTDDTRTWGPWRDAKNTGLEFEVTITQTGTATFSWAIRARQLKAEFFDVVTGDFTAGRSAREGVGAMKVLVKNFRSKVTLDAKVAALEELDIGYYTAAWPHRVEMAFTVAQGSNLELSSIGYSFLQLEDTSGRAVFAVKTLNPNLLAYTVVSEWLPNGAGRASGRVDQGLWAGATRTECWDTAFKVTWYQDPGATSGNAADCVTVTGF